LAADNYERETGSERKGEEEREKERETGRERNGENE